MRARTAPAPRRLASAPRIGGVRALARAPPPHRRDRALTVTVRANELNKWANHDASDDIDGDNEGDYTFDRDTSRVVLRVLTARSVQRVLEQLGETDLFVQQWFHNYCADNPPLEGDPFIMKLFRQRAVYASDPRTGVEHFVSPAQLAHRVLATRELMARTVTQGFPEFVTRTNIECLRAHLEANSYTSGSHAAAETPESGGKRKK